MINGKSMIQAEEMTNFITNINGTKISKKSSEILLRKMAEKSDHCSSDSNFSIRTERFNNQVADFAKKKSLYKNIDYKM